MLLISLGIYIISSFIIQIGLFRNFSITKWIQLFFLVIFSFNLIILSILSLFKLANQIWFVLILQIIACGVTCLYVIRLDSFSVKSAISDIQKKLTILRKIDLALFGLIGIVLSAFFAVGISTPPNNIDSLGITHLTRVYYWIQQGSIITDRFHHVSRPIISHINDFWLFLFGRSENLFFIVQWFSLVVALVTSYRISRLLSFSVTKSLVSAFVILSFPVVLLQTYSSQGDLTVAAWILISISFAIEYLMDKKLINIIGAVISIIMALGTKNTAFLVIPLFSIYIFIWLFKNKKIRKVNIPIAIIIIIIILFSGFQVVRNYSYSLSTFGDDGLLNGISSSIRLLIGKANYNLPRYTYKLIGFDGLPVQIQTTLNNGKAELFSRIFSQMDLHLENEKYLQPGYSDGELFQYRRLNVLNEESSWFGPLGFLLIPLALVISLFSKTSIRSKYSQFSVLLFISYLFLVLLQRPGWDPYQGRYFISAVLPCAPLIPILIPDKKFFKVWIPILIVVISFSIASFSYFTNVSKPIITKKESKEFIYGNLIPIVGENFTQIFIKEKLRYVFAYLAESTPRINNIYSVQYLNQVYFNNPHPVKDVIFINSLIPENETIYFWLEETNLEYGLFGRNKTRDLIMDDEFEFIETGYYVTNSSNIVAIKEGIELLGDNGDFKVFFISKN